MFSLQRDNILGRTKTISPSKWTVQLDQIEVASANTQNQAKCERAKAVWRRPAEFGPLNTSFKLGPVCLQSGLATKSRPKAIRTRPAPLEFNKSKLMFRQVSDSLFCIRRPVDFNWMKLRRPYNSARSWQTEWGQTSQVESRRFEKERTTQECWTRN